MIILPDGVIATRPGMVLLGTGVAGTIYSLCQKKPSFPLVGHYSDKTLRMPITAYVLKTYSADAPGQFEFFNDILLHTNGIDTMQQWDGTALTTSDVVGSPLSRMVLRHNDRIFAANGSVLYETTVDSAVDYAGGAAWNIGQGEGGDITGLGSLGGDLYVFKRQRIYRMTGYTKSERVITLFTDRFGCVAPNSIKPVNLKSQGDVLLFVETQKRICALNTTSVWDIGEFVQPRLDKIVATGSYYNLNMPLVSAEVSDIYKQYILRFPSSLTGVPNVVLCVAMDSPFSCDYGTRWGITEWRTGGFNTTMNCFAETSDYGLLMASVNNAGTLSYPYQMLPGSYTDDALGENRPITATFRTRDEDCENDQSIKQWRRMMFRVSISLAAGYDTSFNFTQYNDYETAVQANVQTITQTSAYANFAGIFEKWIDLLNSSSFVSTKLSVSAVATAIRYHGLEIYYKKGPTENRI